jgi:prepilin-type N-terminal cleavage/methylation domain-containing protein
MGRRRLLNRNQLVRNKTTWDRSHPHPQVEIAPRQRVTVATRRWSTDCSNGGMRSDHGFTMFELLIVMALIAIFSAMGIPTLQESTRRNSVWSASELIGSQIRQARLKAISRNMSFQVRFNCPGTGQFRVLQVTATINDADRCTTQLTYDTGIMVMPTNVSFGTPASLTVNSRGVYASTATITVTHSISSTSRSMTMSPTGQITFGAY